MFGLVDLSQSGELPTSRLTTKIEQIPYLVMRIGQMLVDIKPHLVNKHMTPVYGFTVRNEYKKTLINMLDDILNEGLPNGCSYYESDGIRVYDMRGPCGGVVTSVCFYLIAK